MSVLSNRETSRKHTRTSRKSTICKNIFGDVRCAANHRHNCPIYLSCSSLWSFIVLQSLSVLYKVPYALLQFNLPILTCMYLPIIICLDMSAHTYTTTKLIKDANRIHRILYITYLCLTLCSLQFGLL